jgi:hypothetical protein
MRERATRAGDPHLCELSDKHSSSARFLRVRGLNNFRGHFFRAGHACFGLTLFAGLLPFTLGGGRKLFSPRTCNMFLNAPT